jgi:MIP family channel proteins
MHRLRLCASELIGTFVLVFVGVAAVSASKAAHPPGGDLLAISLAFGLAVAAIVAATGHVSGAHINPAVTAALLASGKIGIVDAVGYILSQLIGATLAAFACEGLIGGNAAAGAATGISSVSAGQALGLEAIVTFILVLVIFGTAVDMRAQKLPALFIGLTVTVDILVAGPYTGGSMNPARSFGPAVVGGVWNHHWIYWVGPIAGAVAAGWIYTWLFLPRTAAEALPAVRPDAAAVRRPVTV